MARWERALVVGASSGMGAEIARQLAAEGTRVALVARRLPELQTLARELNGDGEEAQSNRALIYAHNVADTGDVPALLQTICRDLGGLDLFVYAAGVMPPVKADEWNFDKDQQILNVNVLGAIAWMNEVAQRFAVARAGTIVGLGSVAGDRGRRGQPVYCTSKAALETYLEAVRNRVGHLGVRVVTIKPGPVDTPMTAQVDKKPLLIPASKAARAILQAAHRGPLVTYVPSVWRVIMAIIRAIPSPIMQKLNL